MHEPLILTSTWFNQFSIFITAEKKVPSHDPEHYINEVFSDIFDETNERTKVEKGLVAYEGAKKIITPEKKPVPVLYYSNESNLKTNETANGHLKVSCNQFFKEERRMSWPSGWCIGLRSWLRGFDAQLGHLYDACTSLPQKSQAAIKWLEIRKKKKKKKKLQTFILSILTRLLPFTTFLVKKELIFT